MVLSDDGYKAMLTERAEGRRAQAQIAMMSHFRSLQIPELLQAIHRLGPLAGDRPFTRRFAPDPAAVYPAPHGAPHEMSGDQRKLAEEYDAALRDLYDAALDVLAERLKPYLPSRT